MRRYPMDHVVNPSMTHQLARPLLAAAVCLTACSNVPSVDGAPRFPTELAASLEEVVEDYAEEVEAPGLQVTVVLEDGAAWTRPWGVWRRDPAAQVHENTRFRIGSLTKSFTSALVLLLVEDGYLSFETSIAELVPDPPLDEDITIRQLLDHTSGIFNYTDDASFVVRGKEPAEPLEVVEFALEHDPVFAPGEGFSYSNTGFYLAALAAEAVTGEPFFELLRSRLLDPLSLSSTSLQPCEDAPRRLSEGHIGSGEATDLVHMSWAWAAGGMVSTSAEICRWLDLLLSEDLLPEPMLEEMLTIQPMSSRSHGEGSGYGLGIRVEKRGDREVTGHTGSTTGFRGEAFLHRPSGGCVAVLTNDFLAVPRKLADPIWEALFSIDER